MGLSSPYLVHFRQLWQCHPQHNTNLRDRPDSSFAANQKASFPLHCSVQEPHTVAFPAFHLLRHFSSVRWKFSKCSTGGTSTEGQVGRGLWLTPNNLARTGHSSLHNIPCAKAVNSKQVDLYIPRDPVK